MHPLKQRESRAGKVLVFLAVLTALPFGSAAGAIVQPRAGIGPFAEPGGVHSVLAAVVLADGVLGVEVSDCALPVIESSGIGPFAEPGGARLISAGELKLSGCPGNGPMGLDPARIGPFAEPGG